MTVGAAHVALVGLSGTGKSTVAPRLAARRGVRAVDLDGAVVAAAGRPVAEVVAHDGEPAFRDLESAALIDALAGPPAVLATGGGVVLRPENRAALRRGAAVVWLRAGTDELWERLAADDEVRPLLADGPRRLAAMAVERAPLYEEVADVTVDVGGLDLDAVVDAVEAALGAAPQPAPGTGATC